MSLLFNSPIQHEPKSTNRFVLRFPSDIGIQTFHVVSMSEPKITMETKDMQFINTKTYVNLAYAWEAMTIVCRDFIAPSGTQAIMEWIRLCAESVTGRMGYAIGYAKDLEIETLDPTGVVISKWLLEKCIPKTFAGYKYDYKSAEVAEITLEVQPQRCILIA